MARGKVRIILLRRKGLSATIPGLRPLFFAPQGLRTQPRVLTLGIVHQEPRALTRRYLVAPCWENTRSAGLEVLKGRQTDRPDKVEAVGWFNCRTSQLRTLTYARQEVRTSSGTRISRPFRANRLYEGSQG
jgi:hypothetical protein